MVWVEQLPAGDWARGLGTPARRLWMADWHPFRLGLPVLFVAAALCLTLTLQRFEADRPTLFLFFAAIAASAWFGGKRSGAVAVTLSIPAGIYFYATSLDGFAIRLDNIVLLAIFITCAGVGNMLSNRQRLVEDGLRATHLELQRKARELQESNDALLTEMAERRRAEQALQDARAHLARMSRLTSLGELAATIAHEINQPLTAVMTSAGSCQQWLRADPPNVREAQRAAERIIRDGDRAGAVIARIRASLKQGTDERRPLDVNAVLTDVLDLLQTDLQRHQIAVETRLAAGLPPVAGDRVQLQQLFLNLFMNAIEAMAAAPSRPRLLRVHTALQDDRLAIAISDTGDGFAEAIADTLFDPFVTTKPMGMGLGLSICRSIIEAHGGTLEAGPASPTGARFDILLPGQDG
jgi:C4-dicarboxylate-specific signal transduction histidine kinase